MWIDLEKNIILYIIYLKTVSISYYYKYWKKKSWTFRVRIYVSTWLVGMFEAQFVYSQIFRPKTPNFFSAVLKTIRHPQRRISGRYRGVVEFFTGRVMKMSLDLFGSNAIFTTRVFSETYRLSVIPLFATVA